MDRRNKKPVFVITTIDKNGVQATFEFERDHHAESMLRALVHSNYIVTIRETWVQMTPEEIQQHGFCQSEPGRPAEPVNTRC